MTEDPTSGRGGAAAGDQGRVRLELVHFVDRVGETFVLSAEGYEGTCDLRLAETIDLGERIGVGERETPFTLRFRGPSIPGLPQRIYYLDHPDLGLHEVFLVPLAQDAEGRTYEAVFT